MGIGLVKKTPLKTEDVDAVYMRGKYGDGAISVTYVWVKNFGAPERNTQHELIYLEGKK